MEKEIQFYKDSCEKAMKLLDKSLEANKSYREIIEVLSDIIKSILSK